MKKLSIISYTFIICALLIISGVLSGKISFGHGLGDIYYILYLAIALIIITILFIAAKRDSNNSPLSFILLLSIIGSLAFFFANLSYFRGTEYPLEREFVYVMEDILNTIRDYADTAHGTQMRKYTPERYIVHPIRVMETCRQYDPRLPILAAALLHDVLEDTPVTEAEMRDFLHTVMEASDAEKTLELVVELTDVYVKEAYPQWNRRVRKDRETERIALTSADSQTIKYADIIDNCKEIAKHDRGFAPRFLKECLANLKVADKGNPELYRQALEMVKGALAELR